MRILLQGTVAPALHVHMAHVVLAGDSIFDNAAYTSGAPDVVTHLRRHLPQGWSATLVAVDGATTAGLPAQLARVPDDATHLVVSVGGNDALRHTDLLAIDTVSSVALLGMLAERVASFERAYVAALREAAARRLPTTVCTIYNGRLDRGVATAARIALTAFNDAILRTALEFGMDVIELRSVCTEPADYANPIEPSDAGGRKIAAAIARAVGARPSASAAPRLWR